MALGLEQKEAMSHWPACHDVATLKVFVSPPKIAHYSTGFLHQETPGRNIPRAESHFPKPVHTAAGQVSQVQRRRSGASHTGHFPQY